MLETITPDVHKKLEEIGFEKDEINMIRIVHELKSRAYSIDIRKLINQVAFEHLSKGISEVFERNMWNEDDFYETVENHRRKKKK